MHPIHCRSLTSSAPLSIYLMFRSRSQCRFLLKHMIHSLFCFAFLSTGPRLGFLSCLSLCRPPFPILTFISVSTHNGNSLLIQFVAHAFCSVLFFCVSCFSFPFPSLRSTELEWETTSLYSLSYGFGKKSSFLFQVAMSPQTSLNTDDFFSPG